MMDVIIALVIGCEGYCSVYSCMLPFCVWFL